MRQFFQRGGLSAAQQDEFDLAAVALPGVQTRNPLVRQRADFILVGVAWPMPRLPIGDFRPISAGRSDNGRHVRPAGGIDVPFSRELQPPQRNER